MTCIRRVVRHGLLFWVALATTWLTPQAQAAYPEQPIKMIVAYSAGGGTDLVARLLAQTMQKYLGPNAAVVVVNRPGAGGRSGFPSCPVREPMATPSVSSTHPTC